MSMLKDVTGVSTWRIAKCWFISKSSTILPPSRIKNWYLRRTGAKIHKTAFISPDVLLDPVFSHLINIQEHALIGFGAKLMTHVVKQDLEGKRSIAAKPILIGANAFIGGYTTLRGGVEVKQGARVGSDVLVLEDVIIGRNATVYDYCVLSKNVPNDGKARGKVAEIF